MQKTAVKKNKMAFSYFAVRGQYVSRNVHGTMQLLTVLSVVDYLHHLCCWVRAFCSCVLCEDWGRTLFPAASSHRLGSGRVLSPISGVQRQSGISILQRSRTPCWLSGLTSTPACRNQPVTFRSRVMFCLCTHVFCCYVFWKRTRG